MLRRILIVLGALVALLPYLGLPRSWDNFLFTVIGLAITLLLISGKRPRSDESTETHSLRSAPSILPSRPTAPAQMPTSTSTSTPDSAPKIVRDHPLTTERPIAPRPSETPILRSSKMAELRVDRPSTAPAIPAVASVFKQTPISSVNVTHETAAPKPHAVAHKRKRKSAESFLTGSDTP